MCIMINLYPTSRFKTHEMEHDMGLTWAMSVHTQHATSCAVPQEHLKEGGKMVDFAGALPHGRSVDGWFQDLPFGHQTWQQKILHLWMNCPFQCLPVIVLVEGMFQLAMLDYRRVPFLFRAKVMPCQCSTKPKGANMP